MVLKPEGYETADPWEIVHEACERGRAVDAMVARVTWPDGKSPVWELSFPALALNGIRGLVPASETGLADKGLMQRFVGQIVRVRIKGLQKREGLVACSRAEAVSEAQRIIYDRVKEGDVLDCAVKAVLPRSEEKPPRLLLDVGGGVLVEVPRRRASYIEAVPLAAQFVPGQPVRAKVTRMEPQKGLLEVSIRDALPVPWEKADFRRGDIVAGVIRWIGPVHDKKFKIERKSILVEVPPGILGIASFPTRGNYQKGASVTCAVKRFDAAARIFRLQLVGRRYDGR